ncbi:hypothetical protein ATO11_15080 [Pseudaestuariivita atlantica]|uniref:VWFA domain-containing protein n=2 Tax=Pseudaestuariivita atlantica TaxID=1317121 RepID=A0A0L1JN09_9RHOB|nr:hypothetical protein ATO11_15080 [Pseudaestuariivita atlantica]
MEFKPGDEFTIFAEGKIANQGPTNLRVPPEGSGVIAEKHSSFPAKGFAKHGLIGRIKADDGTAQMFAVTSETQTIKVEKSGNLSFIVNDNEGMYGDNGGSFDVTISRLSKDPGHTRGSLEVLNESRMNMRPLSEGGHRPYDQHQVHELREPIHVQTPRTTVEIVFDASGSMDTEIELNDRTEKRIDVARFLAKKTAWAAIPPQCILALRVFGPKLPGAEEQTRSNGDSYFTTLMSPPHLAEEHDQVAGALQEVHASGATPIAASLARVPDDLGGTDPESHRIVALFTDGDENCDGNVDEAIQYLTTTGHDVVLNIVGLNISDDAHKEKFERWAAAGNGTYFDAGHPQAMQRSMALAVNAPFTVTSTSTGEMVFKGHVSGESAALDPGEYTVSIGRNFRTNVEIEPGQKTRIVVGH